MQIICGHFCQRTCNLASFLLPPRVRPCACGRAWTRWGGVSCACSSCVPDGAWALR